MSTILNENLLLAIPLAPLAGSLIAGLFGKAVGRAGAHSVTILGVAISFVLSMLVFFQVLDGASFNATDLMTSLPWQGSLLARSLPKGGWLRELPTGPKSTGGLSAPMRSNVSFSKSSLVAGLEGAANTVEYRAPSLCVTAAKR